MTDQSAVLPAELLVYSFSHLEQPDILRVSGVSARWRALAMEDRNYYQHISYHFRSPHETRRVADHLNYIFAAASAFEKAMRRFCASETKPRLNVTFRAVNSSSSLYDFDQDDFREMILPTVLPELQRSMTHVVNLALIVDAIYWPDVSEVLHLPAPRLESLDIRLRYGRQLALKPRGYQLVSKISHTLERLWHVAFHDVDDFGHAATPLLNIRSVLISSIHHLSDIINLFEHFPSVKYLVIENFALYGFEQRHLATPRSKEPEPIQSAVMRKMSFLERFRCSFMSVGASEVTATAVAACGSVARLNFDLTALNQVDLSPLLAAFDGVGVGCHAILRPRTIEENRLTLDESSDEAVEFLLQSMDLRIERILWMQRSQLAPFIRPMLSGLTRLVQSLNIHVSMLQLFDVVTDHLVWIHLQYIRIDKQGLGHDSTQFHSGVSDFKQSLDSRFPRLSFMQVDPDL